MNIATLEDLAEMEKRISTLILRQPAALPEETWLTIEQVAQRTGHNPGTVRRWLKTGKRLADGSCLTLASVRFCVSGPRISLAALRAFAEAK